MSNRLRAASLSTQAATPAPAGGETRGVARVKQSGTPPQDRELPKPKLVWVLGVLFGVLALAAAVAAFSMWLILRHH